MKARQFVLTVGIALLGASATFAETYEWQGGETTAGSWNTPGNWDPSGVPGGGDTAKIGSLVTFTDAISIASGELVIANTKAVTVSGVISGAGSLRNNSTANLTLSGANTFTGGMTVNGNITLANASALGVLSTPVRFYKGCNMRFACPNATYKYDIKPMDAECTHYFRMNAAGTLDGSIENSDISMFAVVFTTESGCSCNSFVINGRVWLGNDSSTGGSLQILPRGGSAVFKILGGTKTKEVYGDAGGDGYSPGWRHLGGACEIQKITLAYVYGIKCLSSTVLSEDTHIYMCTYADGDKGCVDLNGYSQTANRIETATVRDNTLQFWRIYTPPASPATLTLKPTKDSLTNSAYVQGATTIVLDAPSASTVHVFQGRTSPTTGDLIVSNGILRISDNAAFPNVPKIVVADGGIFDLRTATASALSGVTEIQVADGGTLAVDAAAANAFAAREVALSIETGATLTLGAGVSLKVKSFSIDGNLQTKGIYAYGDGDVDVPTSVSPSATGVWTGAGDTASASDQKNWEGGYPGVIDLTFATGGTEAVLDEDLVAKSVTFTLPSAATSFEIRTNGTTDAKLYVSENVSMTEGSQPQTVKISSPIQLAGTKPTLSVAGAGSTLVVDGPISQGTVSAMTLTKAGSGVLYLNATNSTLTSCTATFRVGTTYLKGGALGGTPTSPTVINVNGNTSYTSPLYLTGGIYNQKIMLATDLNGIKFHAMPGTTNVINGLLQVQTSGSDYLSCQSNSCVTLNGGYKSDWIYQYQPQIEFFEGATLNINGTYTVTRSLARFWSRGTGRKAEEQNVTFAGTGSKALGGLNFTGPMKVTFMADNVFSNDKDSMLTPLYLLRINIGSEMYKPTIIDLNGHDQGFGSFMAGYKSGDFGTFGDNTASYFTSASPATLGVRQTGSVSPGAWYPTFRGLVSLVKSGTNTLTLAGASTSTGRLEVAEGRLDFTGSGAWQNVSAVAVSGGVLAITKASQLKKDADYYLSAGKLDIAAGVTLKAANLYVPDGASGWTRLDGGTYTKANLPGCISGDGRLRVRGGTVMFLK